MSCPPFNVIKRAGESKLQPVIFASNFGLFTVDFFSVQIFDADNNNVTDEILNPDFNAFDENTVEFMLIAGTEGAQYTGLVNAHSAEGETAIAEFLLTIIP